MAKLSVIIPSRQERYLYPTIRDCFAKAAGEVEVVVHLDGYWPSDWKTMTDAYPNLHTVHSGEAVGMRPGINKAAGSAISRGAKYLFKLDAHCMLDEGYDLKLQSDMDQDWIVVPRRKRLDAENWQLQDVGKPDIDYHYLSFPDDPDDWGGPGLNGKPWTQRILERLGKPEYDIDDECSSQGSAWAIHAEYFTYLGLMDTKSYGPFWNEFQECGMCCWLSGGSVKVNKKTWYAHLRKGKEYEGADGKKGRGYTLPESWLKSGRDHTMKWIWNEAWDQRQIRPFKWLIEKFPNMPGWPDNWEEILYATRRPRVVPGYMIGVDVGEGKDKTVVQDGQGRIQGLTIYQANYGIRNYVGDFIDVTERLQNLAYLNNDSLDIVVNNSTLTPGQNPFRGQKKRLHIVYSIDGIERVERIVEEKDWLIIGPVQPRTVGLSEIDWSKVPPKRVEKINSTDDELHRDGDKGTVVGENEFGLLVQWDDGVPAGRVPQDKIRLLEHETGYHGDRLVRLNESAAKVESHLKRIVGVTTDPPRTPAALNDYLIRKFHISPQRLRGPMPIELRDFHRNDLAQLFAELGFKRGAEIGVAEGNYSEVLLKANPECELLLVDPWHHYSDNPQGKSKEKHEYAFEKVKYRVAGTRAVLIGKKSMDAVRDVEEDSLDFCYIDGNHLFDYVMQDLIEWSKRVRSGGVVSGDDYYALDQKRWVGGGVVEAVQAYVNAHRIPIWYIFQGHKSVDFMWCKS